VAGSNFDAAVFGSPQNVYYFTGYWTHWARQSALILFSDGRTVLYSPNSAAEGAAVDDARSFEASWFSTMRQEQAMAVAAQLVEVLHDGKAKKIGVDASAWDEGAAGRAWTDGMWTSDQGATAPLAADAVADGGAGDAEASGALVVVPGADAESVPVSRRRFRTAFMKLRSGGQLTAEETAILDKVRQAGGAGMRRGSGGNEGVYGGRYIVFVKRPSGPTPVWVRTGLTDLDYSEVVSGLSESDSVLVLPSASLVQSQQEMQERANRATGGGAVPGMRQQQQQTGGAR